MIAPVNPSGDARLAPGPRGLLLLGMLLEIRRDRLRFVTRIRAEYGAIVRFKMGRRVLHLVSGASEVRHVLVDNAANYTKGVGLAEARRWLGNGLVTSEGTTWARQRRLMQPAFHRHRTVDFARLVTTAAAGMLLRWRAAPSDQAVNVADEFMGITLDVIARAMFRTAIDDDPAVRRAFTTALHDAMARMTEFVPVPTWLPTPGNVRFVRAIKTLSHIVDSILERHAHDGSGTPDLLSMFAPNGESGEVGFSRQEIRDQIMTILLAGHETTAHSIAWTCYLLAQHPTVQEEVAAELATVLDGRTPSQVDLEKVPRLKMVYEEALRLYPPVWLIPRRAQAADTLGGYEVPPDSDVLISPWVIHRDPAHWENPDAFDPNRFDPSCVAARRPYVYLPFGAGPRACIGITLAMMEGLLVLAMVLQQYRLQLAPTPPVVPDPTLTLRFRHGLPLLLVPR
jgi:enediyne biosynthesis protein E7